MNSDKCGRDKFFFFFFFVITRFQHALQLIFFAGAYSRTIYSPLFLQFFFFLFGVLGITWRRNNIAE